MIRNSLRYDVKRDVLRCDTCDFEFLRRNTENEKEYYQSETYRKKHGPDLTKQSSCKEAFDMYFPFQQPIIDRLKPILRKEIRILDIGCSTGHFLASLKGLVDTRVGLELSHDEVDFIRGNLDFPVYDQPIETVSMKEGPFDLITVLQVLEHIDNPHSFLEGIKRHLKPDGYVYIEVPNLHDALLSAYDIPSYADFYYRAPHVSYFSSQSLSVLMQNCGYAGTIDNVQRFNILNHMHWKLTGKPMPNFVLGNCTPKLSERATAAMQNLNAFIGTMDTEYKALLEKHGIGESITFLGKLA